MYETHCIFCGNKLDWSADFTFDEVYTPEDEKDLERVVTEMVCHNCGATATFIAPRQ